LSFALIIHHGIPVIRQILVKNNKHLAQQAADDLASLTTADRERVEEAARLEGITLQEAMERKRGFRYLY
jgi:hypothetical protein